MRKEAVVIPLLFLTTLTSCLIVLDASDWYGALYKSTTVFGIELSSTTRGTIFAAILEAFLAITLSVRVYGANGLPHVVANRVLVFLGSVFFIVVGIGTYQGILEGNEQRFSADPNTTRQITEVNKSIAENERNTEFFRVNNQPRNLSKAVADRKDLDARLARLNSQTGTTGGGRTTAQLWFLGGAKFAMLGGNVFSLWLVGWILRKRGSVVVEEGVPTQTHTPNAPPPPPEPPVSDEPPPPILTPEQVDELARGLNTPPLPVSKPPVKIPWPESQQEWKSVFHFHGFPSWEAIATALKVELPQLTTIVYHGAKVIPFLERYASAKESASENHAANSTSSEAARTDSSPSGTNSSDPYEAIAENQQRLGGDADREFEP